LKKLEILTIGDLAKSDVKVIELHLKSHGRMLWEFANGIDHSAVHAEQSEAKGIGNSTTLREDLVTEQEAYPVLLMLAESVGKRLRKAGQKAGMVSVEIKYSTFHKVSHQQQLRPLANADDTIYQAACHLFDELWNGEPVRLLGIRTSKLAEEEEPEQLSIFDIEPVAEKSLQIQSLDSVRKEAAEDTPALSEELVQKKLEKQKRLSEAMDAIRNKFGEGAISRGILLQEQKSDKSF